MLVLTLTSLFASTMLADTESFSWSDASQGKHHFSFLIENDRLNSTDDYHTHSFRFHYFFPGDVPLLAVRFSHETLTQRENGTRTDLVNFGLSMKQQYWTSGDVTYYAGGIVNGDLGGQCFQNTLHRWLNESEVHLDYPEAHTFGMVGEIRLDQKIANVHGFAFAFNTSGRLLTGAGASNVKGAVTTGRSFNINTDSFFSFKIGISMGKYFWIDDTLTGYYGSGYSLDANAKLKLKWFFLKFYYQSDPYGIDQGIAGVGLGFDF